jgi:CRISPR/Cas system CSM-associated protein Csm3 (group 7 of RAMP superfamily)
MTISSMHLKVNFELQSYWHIGSGLEGGAYADALALKNNHGLPYIPGKSIKGLLKEAFTQAHDNGWFSENTSPGLITLLFGAEGPSGIKEQGLIQLSNATLSDDETNFFINTPQAKSNLFNVIASTAIDDATGVAKETSLRSMEVVVPMNLSATLSINTNHPLYRIKENQIAEQMQSWLNITLTLITKLGAKRHRGLGQVIVSASALPTNVAEEQ